MAPLRIVEGTGMRLIERCLQLRIDYGVVYDHARHGFAVRFLLRRVDTVSVGVHCRVCTFF